MNVKNPPVANFTLLRSLPLCPDLQKEEKIGVSELLPARNFFLKFPHTGDTELLGESPVTSLKKNVKSFKTQKIDLQQNGKNILRYANISNMLFEQKFLDQSKPFRRKG